MEYRNHNKQKAQVGNLFEWLFYEIKPYALIVVAIICAKNHYATTGLAKLSVGLLFLASAYIIYSRLVHRGYLK